jgi:hypothetical protein
MNTVALRRMLLGDVSSIRPVALSFELRVNGLRRG